MTEVIVLGVSRSSLDSSRGVRGRCSNRNKHLRSVEVMPSRAAADSGWRIVTEPDDPGLAVRLADAPPVDAWDATGFHCPSYVRGVDKTGAVVERIYYASSAGWESLYGPYRIGLLQWDGQAWQRHEQPVFSADEPWERDTVLEPNVLYHEGRWLLRYTAGLAAGAEPATGVAESLDGIGGWRRIGTRAQDCFDTFVAQGDDGFDRITARHPLDSAFTSAHGLWWARGDAPDGVWEPDHQLLRTADGTPWHDAGAWKPTAVTDKGDLVVFFTVAQRGGNPYVPALGVGVLRLSRGLRGTEPAKTSA
jgi:predicted GH43/DUF377 family glycosyl hydrolase